MKKADLSTRDFGFEEKSSDQEERFFSNRGVGEEALKRE